MARKSVKRKRGEPAFFKSEPILLSSGARIVLIFRRKKSEEMEGDLDEFNKYLVNNRSVWCRQLDSGICLGLVIEHLGVNNGGPDVENCSFSCEACPLKEREEHNLKSRSPEWIEEDARRCANLCAGVIEKMAQ